MKMFPTSPGKFLGRRRSASALLAANLLVSALIVFVPAAHTAAATGEKLESWQQVIRKTPYWISQGVAKNLFTIRRWVLNGESFCENPDRHILFDLRGTFLGYVPNSEDPAQTQADLNQLRSNLATSGRVDYWVPGQLNSTGYPFALNCNQPNAQLDMALARYRGTDESARLWGTWDGMKIGSEDKMVSLHEAIEQVYEFRKEQGRVSLPPEVLSTLAGKAMIESGGQQAAHSAADARGIMQLSVGALTDCGLDETFHFHRMAQIDCAMRLLEQNHRNLEPVFRQAFGHLPETKANELYSLLLIQAYHGGVGRVSGLLSEPSAKYFAEHHQRFSAGDMALGMIFHNLGRHELGFASLYYVTDVAIATEEVCRAIGDLPGC